MPKDVGSFGMEMVNLIGNLLSSLHFVVQRNMSVRNGSFYIVFDILLLGFSAMSTRIWNPGKVLYYGRAELKTSDHR